MLAKKNRLKKACNKLKQTFKMVKLVLKTLKLDNPSPHFICKNLDGFRTKMYVVCCYSFLNADVIC